MSEIIKGIILFIVYMTVAIGIAKFLHFNDNCDEDDDE